MITYRYVHIYIYTLRTLGSPSLQTISGKGGLGEVRGGISKKRDFGGGCNHVARGCVVHVFQGGIAMLLLCFQGGVATLLICLRVKQTMRRQNALGRHRIHIKAANAQVLAAAALQRKPGMQTILEALQVYRTACSKRIVQTSPADCYDG